MAAADTIPNFFTNFLRSVGAIFFIIISLNLAKVSGFHLSISGAVWANLTTKRHL